jgi:pimeloyl-ACP methyl ester carboxylesterase
VPGFFSTDAEESVRSVQSLLRMCFIWVAQAQVHLMANAGHAPFWDEAPAFNERLRAFARAATAACL